MSLGLGPEYNTPSVMEALEELAFACYNAGLRPPKKVVFNKGDLDRVSAMFEPKEKFQIKMNTQTESVSVIKSVTTTLGTISLEEE